MRFLLFTFFASFLFHCNVHSDIIGVEDDDRVDESTPHRAQQPLTNDAIAKLPAYTNVYVGLIHWTFDNAPGDVPDVENELNGLHQIFAASYGFSVESITIPKEATAQEALEKSITSFYSKIKGDSALAILVYGGHGASGGKWTSTT